MPGGGPHRGTRSSEPSASDAAGAPVLLSWVAVRNDPFNQPRKGESPTPGPTLNLLCHPESPYAGRVKDVVLLHRVGEDDRSYSEQDVAERTASAIRERVEGAKVQLVEWRGDDPTDHRALYEFLQLELPKLRRRYRGRELVIHISPGTPSMATVWVLMAETGFIQPPFSVVKSYREHDRRGRPPVVPVEVGLETFYKVFQETRPQRLHGEEELVEWDPATFQSERLRALAVEARRFARLKIPVLILGERGTGKTGLAGWMRATSPFRKPELDRSWPVVPCGQYTGDTMRAELFGYEKGAFTGATATRTGLLDAADGDTLFLDEVGDVPRDLQRLLIKAVEEKQFTPIGSSKPRRSDFRLLTATNKPMRQLAEEIDADFLDRISPATVVLPPLREVPEELPAAWKSVLSRAARRAGISARDSRIPAKQTRLLMARLKTAALPGNYRDLFRVAYRLLAARTDPHDPLTPDESLEYALLALQDSAAHAIGEDMDRALARAFADSRPPGPVIPHGERVETKRLFAAQKRWLSKGMRSAARERGVAVGDLVDVTDRALRKWDAEE